MCTIVKLAAWLMIASSAWPGAATERAAAAKPTTIQFAGGGGITNWQTDASDRSVIYLRDRSLKWYRVALASPCVPRERDLTINYTIDPSGTFDTFSTISFPRYPGVVCGVKAIFTSAPPPGQPGAPRSDQDR